LNSNDKELLNAFNEIFIGAFEIKGKYDLPFVLFFKVMDSEVRDIEIVELEQTKLIFAFKELYDIIENYIKNNNTNNFKTSNFQEYKHTRFLKSVKKIVLDKFVQYLFDKAMEYANHNFF
jgi:hypothetical protein